MQSKLNEILELCIEKSDGIYFYEFRLGKARLGSKLYIRKVGVLSRTLWVEAFDMGELESALEYMQNE